MRSQFGAFKRDYESMIEEKEKPPPPLPEAPKPSMAIKGPTLGEEKLRLDAEIKELEADIAFKLSELPRWIRWLIRKGWPSIFKNL